MTDKEKTRAAVGAVLFAALLLFVEFALMSHWMQ